jgi:hypothetical protein
MPVPKWPKKPESADDRVNRIGTGVSLAVLCVAIALTGMWLVFTPSFEKCSVLGAQSKRIVCFENVRDGLMKFPAKGGRPPALNNSN